MGFLTSGAEDADSFLYFPKSQSHPQIGRSDHHSDTRVILVLDHAWCCRRFADRTLSKLHMMLDHRRLRTLALRCRIHKTSYAQLRRTVCEPARFQPRTRACMFFKGAPVPRRLSSPLAYGTVTSGLISLASIRAWDDVQKSCN